MRILTRGWCRFVAWCVSRRYLADRHASDAAEVARLKGVAGAELDRAERYLEQKIQLQAELDEARQRVKDLESDMRTARRAAELDARQHTLQCERYERMIATEVAKRLRVMTDSQVDDQE